MVVNYLQVFCLKLCFHLGRTAMHDFCFFLATNNFSGAGSHEKHLDVAGIEPGPGALQASSLFITTLPLRVCSQAPGVLG